MADVLHSITSHRTGRRQNLLSSQRAIQKGSCFSAWIYVLNDPHPSDTDLERYRLEMIHERPELTR
jgi:hypothetical protein